MQTLVPVPLCRQHLSLCADNTCPCPTVQTALVPVPLCRQHLSLSHCVNNTCPHPTIQAALVPVPLRRQCLNQSHCADSTCPCPTVQTALVPVPLCRQHLSLSHSAGNTCPCPTVQTTLDLVPLCRQHLSLSPCWWNHSMAQERQQAVWCVSNNAITVQEDFLHSLVSPHLLHLCILQRGGKKKRNEYQKDNVWCSSDRILSNS